jgi:predicted nucleic acid-binding protein
VSTEAAELIAIPAGDRILLDTSALAAYLDSTEAVHPVAVRILESMVATGRNEAVVSMITVMELLVRPLRSSPPGHDTILQFLAHHPHLRAVPLDLQMAQDAAFLRAQYRFSPPDALVIGTAISCQVAHLVTNDGGWAPKLAHLQARINVCTLSGLVPRP